MIWSVSTLARSSGATNPVKFLNGVIFDAPCARLRPVADIDEMAGDRGRRCHRGADQVRASALALASFKVAIRGARAALARLQDVGVHAQAHAASGLAPFETSRGEYAIESELFRLMLDLLRSRHHHRVHSLRDFLAAYDFRRCTQIADARVGARSDEHAIDPDVFDPRSRLERHVFQRMLGGAPRG